MLVLAEKKSLADKIAEGLSRKLKKKALKKADYYEVGDYKICWLNGHILTIDLDKTFGKSYPVFPEKFTYRVAKGKQKLFKAVKRLIEEAVRKGEEIISAGDPDREGELLVRELLNYLKVPERLVKRAWWNAETPEAVAEGVLKAKPLSLYNSLFIAGRARSYGDAILGINLSRALSDRAGRKGLSVGRVQTPVLRLIVDREREIREFKPTPYWMITVYLEKDGVKFSATATYREKEEAEKSYRALKEADSLQVVKVETKKKRVAPPKLPVLSDVQSEVLKKVKTTPEAVLKAVQELYEAGVISYPRTDCNYLGTEDLPTLEKFLKANYPDLLPKLKDGKVLKRIVNDKLRSKAGHHAVIPIAELPADFSKLHEAVYEAVLKRLLANFMDDYVYSSTAVHLKVGDFLFKALGKTVVVEGWTSLYGSREDKQLPELSKGEQVKKLKEKLEQKETEPPPRYTSSALISIMKKLGLGTEATRSMYEKKLIDRAYIRRSRGVLLPTPAGEELIEAVKELSFSSPEETAKWEEKLQKIALKELSPVQGEREFLDGVVKLTEEGIEALSKTAFKELGKSSKKKEKNSSPATKKQIKFAEKLAEELNTTVPKNCYSDRAKMSNWIKNSLKRAKQLRRG